VLTHSKKVLDGHPSAFAKDDSIHEEKGGKEKRGPSTMPRRLSKTKERSLIPAFHQAAVIQAHPALESICRFRLTPQWNQFPISGSFLD
jgi:hypothetical protein